MNYSLMLPTASDWRAPMTKTTYKVIWITDVAAGSLAGCGTPVLRASLFMQVLDGKTRSERGDPAERPRAR
jgi:hypothetical protein